MQNIDFDKIKAAAEKEIYAELAKTQYIPINFNKADKQILIIGNTVGMFGQYIKNDITGLCNIDYSCINGKCAHNPDVNDTVQYFLNCIKNDVKINIIGLLQTIEYYRQMFSMMIDNKLVTLNKVKKAVKYQIIEINSDNKDKIEKACNKIVSNKDYKKCVNDYIKYINDEYLKFMNEILEKKISYDHIIQNPPYAGSTHLEFLKKGIEIISESKGKMTIIEPATWLINVRKNGKAKTEYADIKKMIDGHVSKVIIENYNKEFNIEIYIPLSITYIDMSQKFDQIEFTCCGEKKYVKSLYDCNLIGEYTMIWSIFDKVQKYGDMMNNHVYNVKKSVVNENTWYCKYPEIFGGCGASFCGTNTPRNGANFNSDKIYTQIINGEYITPYTSATFHYNQNEISNNILCRYDKANNLTDKPADCLYDTKEHLENWKHFVFNNKLPLFLNICLTIDQNNNSKEFVPWLVDKQYTDNEINQLFGFTAEEIAFMNHTIKKFERYSPWFKRYICGKDSVSNEEVQKFIDNL